MFNFFKQNKESDKIIELERKVDLLVGLSKILSEKQNLTENFVKDVSKNLNSRVLELVNRESEFVNLHRLINQAISRLEMSVVLLIRQHPEIEQTLREERIIK